MMPKKKADREPSLTTFEELLAATESEDEHDLSFYLDKRVDTDCTVIADGDMWLVLIGNIGTPISFPTTLYDLVQGLIYQRDEYEEMYEEAGDDRPLRFSESKRDTLPQELLDAEFDSWMDLKVFLGCRDHYAFIEWLDPDDDYDLIIFPVWDDWIVMIGDWHYLLTFPTSLSRIIQAISEQSPDDDMRIVQPPRPSTAHDVRLNTKNLKLAGVDMDFDVKTGGKVLGTLSVSAGGLRWRPVHFQKKHSWIVDWETFDAWVKGQEPT